MRFFCCANPNLLPLDVQEVGCKICRACVRVLVDRHGGCTRSVWLVEWWIDRSIRAMACTRRFLKLLPALIPQLPPQKKIVKAMKPVPFAVAQLAAIRETSVCNYTLTVCTPLLCDATSAAAASNPKAAAAVAPAGVAPLTGAAGESGSF